MKPYSADWAGVARVRFPVGFWVASVIALAAFVAVTAFAAFGSFARRVTVEGQLVPRHGLSTVQATMDGILANVDVEEGQRVEAGTPLALIRSRTATRARGDSWEAMRASLNERRRSLDEALRLKEAQVKDNVENARSQLAEVELELSHLARESSARLEHIAMLELLLSRYENLHKQKYVSDLQLQQQRSTLLEQRTALEGLERSKAALRRQISVISQSASEQQAALQVAQVENHGAQAALEQESLLLDEAGELLLTAPVSGVVASIGRRSGQLVRNGQPILSLWPDSDELEAHLYVPSRAIGFIRPGDSVRLRLDAFPYQRFGHQSGVVVRVSRAALSHMDSAEKRFQDADVTGTYRVVVHLKQQTVRAYGQDVPLLPGMQVQADVVGESRALWEWLLEPLYSVTGRMRTAD